MIGKGKLALALLVAAAGYFIMSRNSAPKSEPLETITVTTKSGSVRGFVRKSRDGRDYYNWVAIPYAKPPLGELRFQDPQPVEPWKGVLDGTQGGRICPQVDYFAASYMGQEDCLVLNVNTPKIGKMELKDQKKLPVIVYIHGGAYIWGSNDYPAEYFMDQDVVVVTINYRLGVLGFLTTGDAIVRGNMGLKDQTLAFKWVKENIQYFGGDPEEVTIFGTSGGAASVHMQTLSPLSKGLFKRAIAQSGAASNQWGFITLEQSLQNLETLAKEFRCPTTGNKKQLADCLKQQDARELVETAFRLFDSKFQLMMPHEEALSFVPTMEAVDDGKAFITKHPLHIIKEGKAQRVPILFSHTLDEGASPSIVLRKHPDLLENFESKLEKRIRQLFQLPKDTPSATAQKILDFYVPKSVQSQDKLEERLQNYTALFSDAFFVYDLQEAVQMQRKYSPVYMYTFAKPLTSIPMLALFYDLRVDWPRWLALPYTMMKAVIVHQFLGYPVHTYGVPHGIDMFLLFPFANFISVGRDDPLYQLSKDHVKMFADFARDENQVVVKGTKLEPLSKDGPLYFMEVSDHTRIVKNPMENRLKFLNSLNIRGL